MNNSLPYFSHDNNALEHPKMQALITAYGFEGYGRFWALNEAIAACEAARLDLTRRVNRMALAARLRFSEAELMEFVRFLADPDMDLLNFEDEIITTDRLQECMDKAKKTREKNREKYENRREKIYPGENEIYPGENEIYPGENEIYPGENLQSRVEKSKFNKSNGGRSYYSDPPGEKITPGENPTGPPTLPPLPLLQKIKEASSRAGFAIADNLAAKLSGLDPAWFDVPRSFPEYAAWYIRGHPKYRGKPPVEQRDLYRKALWSWTNLREDYPAWKEEQTKAAADLAKRNPPGTCPKCGIDIKQKCPQCKGFWYWDEDKSTHAWQEFFQELPPNPLPGRRPGTKIVPQEIPKAVDLEF